MTKAKFSSTQIRPEECDSTLSPVIGTGTAPAEAPLPLAGRGNRREFLTAATGAVAAFSLQAQNAVAQTTFPDKPKLPDPAPDRPKKSVMYSMLPGNLSWEDRFKLAQDVGFEGMEGPPVGEAEAGKIREAADRAKFRIHSVIYGGWDAPLSSGDPEVVARGLKQAESAMRAAKIMGADDILLVPAVVDARTRYVDAYKRSQENVRKLIPIAQNLEIMILVEEVWNNFLLSPLEYCQYIDSFKSKWVQSYFDVGNVVAFAWPEDWILTLGKRIKRVHLKDYKGGPGLFGSRKGDFVNLRDGSIDWPAVRRAFAEIGYTSYMTTELGGGDEAYLRDVVARFDKILAGV